jgi:hypothetical protein
VRLEDQIAEPAAAMHRIQEFIGVPLEAICSPPLGAYRAEAAHDGRHFAPWLRELETALGDCLPP